jgi:PAS domain S-box-containing protein
MAPVRSQAATAPTLVKQVDELTSLYRLTDELYRARSASEVYEAALDAILGTLGCGRASILLFDDAGVMRFVAHRGLSPGYVAAVEGHTPWKPGERDPQPIYVEDIETTEEPDAIKRVIAGEGIRGLAFIPLVVQGGVIGKFMTYYAEPHVFAEHEKDIAVTIARQVGFSVERTRAETARVAAEEDLRSSEERFRLMSEHAPVMIWISDAEGRCLGLNAMLRTFWGVPENAVEGFDWKTMIHPDDAADVLARIGEAAAKRASVVLKGRYRSVLGQTRVLQTNARPNISKGVFLGMIGVNVDVTEREESEAAMRASEERFRMAVEAAPSGMVMIDGKGRIVLANAQAERLFGYVRDEIVGKRFEALVPEGLSAAPAVDPVAQPVGAGHESRAIRKDGNTVPVEIGLSPIEMSDGRMTLASIVDISYRKQAESQRELLLAELNHRVKNTLAVVQSIAHQTFKSREASEDARAAFDGRLLALAMAHNLLTQANWQGASLEEIAADALEVRGANRERVSLKGPAVSLQPKEALAIAMALHELCTNAVKYGALSNESGRVAVEWEKSAKPGSLRLEWREHGGPPVTPPTRRGFGSRLVERTVTQDLDGEISLDFQSDGLRCLIEANLPAAAQGAH